MRRPQKGAPFKGIIFDSAGNRMTPLKAARPGKTTYRYYVSSLIQAGRHQNLGAVTRISAHIAEEIVASCLHELKLCIQTEASPDWSAIRNLIDRVEVTSDAVTLRFDEAMLEQASRNLGPQDRISIDRLECRRPDRILTIPVRVVKRGGAKVAIGPDGQSAIHHRATDPTLSVALIRAEAWKRQLLTGQAKTLNQIAEAEGVTAAYAARTIRTAFLAPA